MSALNKRRLPTNTSYGVKKFENINSWLQSQQNHQYSIDCERRSHSDEEEPLRIKDPKIGSYSPKKAEALYLRRLSRPQAESYNPILDPYSSFSFPSPSLSTRPATLPLINSVNYSSTFSSHSMSYSSLSTATSLTMSSDHQSRSSSSSPSSTSSLPNSLSSLV